MSSTEFVQTSHISMEIPVCLCVYAHKHAPMNVDFLPVDLFVCFKYSLKAWRARFGKFKKHCLKCVIFLLFQVTQK